MLVLIFSGVIHFSLQDAYFLNDIYWSFARFES